jgi:hypothetical protein
MSTTTAAAGTPRRPAPVGAERAASSPTTPVPRPHGATPAPSREAKQRAAVILEVLAGARSTTDAAGVLGVSLPRYYLLEAQALAGLVTACEPRRRGPARTEARRLEELERACARWQRDCARQQALVRAAERTLGLTAPAPPPAKDPGRKRRPRRPVARALQAVARLRGDPDPTGAEASPDVPAPT